MGYIVVIISIIIILGSIIFYSWDSYYIKQSFTGSYMHTNVYYGLSAYSIYSQLDDINKVTIELKVLRRIEAELFIIKHKKIRNL
jgi:hypothetical protein